MAHRTTAATMLQEFSVEMTGKDIDALREASTSLPRGTRVNVTFLGNEDLSMRVAAARTVRELGHVPIPHISARRLTSPAALEEFLAALHSVGAVENIFVVGGDPTTPQGPYLDSLAVIQSGLLSAYGVREVSISGYPEGHPAIDETALWQALRQKCAAIAEQGLAVSVITQFGFDVDPVLTWLEQVREHGLDVPVRIGVPGPAGIRRLLGYARRFGVSTSAGIAKKYGFSITNLMGTTGPDAFLTEFAERYEENRHGQVGTHFYTFGGLKATADWADEFRRKN